MRRNPFEIILAIATVALIAAVLAVEFWPGRGPAPDEVVGEYLDLVRAGDEVGALSLWHFAPAREAPVPAVALDSFALPGVDPASQRVSADATALDSTIRLADTLSRFEVAPATYWTSCCEPVQLADGTDAFSARVQVQAKLHPAGCGLEPDAIPEEDLSDASYTFYLVDTAHNLDAYTWGAPWERWYARPRGRQVWRIVAIDGLP